MRPVFETKMLINQSKANLDVKSLFGKITHLLDPEIRKFVLQNSPLLKWTAMGEETSVFFKFSRSHQTAR